MAEPVMDNPLLGHSPQSQLNKSVQDIIECTAQLGQEFRDSQVPINEDSDTLQRFCAKLEYLLQADQIVHSSFLGGKKDYWDYFCACLSSVKGVRDGIKYVKSIAELKTSLGRGRAFIRFCLVYQRLADSLQQCVMNERQTCEWFRQKSIWRQRKYSSSIINALYDLNSVQFDLAPKGYDLDLSWPSFARRQPGTPYRWNVPLSRTSSMSSLASQDLNSSFVKHDTSIVQSPFNMNDSQTEKLEQDISRAESLRADLMFRIEELEKEVEDAHQMAIQSEEKYMHERQEKNNLDVQCQKLSGQLELMEQKWAEKEEAWLSKQRDFQTLIDELNLKFGLIRSQHDEAVAKLQHRENELLGKLEALEKERGKLSLEVQRLHQELESKTEMESKNAEQISHLEIKVSVTEQKYLEAISKMENLVDEKDSKATSHLDSANKVQELIEKLSNAERNNIDLRSQVDGLARKLDTAKTELLEKEEYKTLMAAGLRAAEGSLADKDAELMEAQQTSADLKQTCADLKQTCADLEQTLSCVSREKEECLSQISRLEDTIKVSQAEHEGLAAQMTEFSRKCTMLEQDKVDLESSLQKSSSEQLEMADRLKGAEEKMRNQANSFATERCEFLAMIENLETDISGLRSSLSSVQQELQEANASKIAVETKLQASESRSSVEREKMQGTVHEVTAKSERIAALENDIHAVSEMINLLHSGELSERQGLSDVLVPLQHKLLEIMREKIYVQSQLKEEQDSNEKNVKQIDVLQQEVNDGRHLLTQSQREADDLKVLLSQLQASETDLQLKVQKLSSAEEERNALVTSTEEMKSSLTSLEKENRDLTESFKEKGLELSKLKACLEEKAKEMDELSLSSKNATDQATSYAEQQSLLLSENTSLKERLELVESERDGLNSQLVNSERDRVKLEQHIHTIREYFSGHSSCEDEAFDDEDETECSTGILKRFEFLLKWKDKFIMNLEETVQTISDERDSLQLDCDNLKKECEENAMKIENITKDYEQVKSDFENVSSAFNSTVAERDEITIEKEDMERQFSASKLENNSLKSSLEQSSNGTQDLVLTIQQRDVTISDLTQTNQKLSQDVNEMGSQIKTLEEQLRETEGSLREASDKNKELMTNESVLREKDNELASVKEENTSLLTQILNSIGEKEGLAQHLEMSEGERKSLAEKVESLEQDLELSAGAVEELRQRLLEVEDEYTSKTSLLEQELSSVKFQLGAEQLQYETALQGYNSHQENLSEIIEKMSNQEQLIQSLELQLEDIRVERDVEVETKWKELEEVKSEVEDKGEMCKVMADNVKQTGRLLEEEKQKCQKLQEQLSSCQSSMESTQQQNDTLMSDNVELKKKLIKLIREKDSLWQKTDKLEYQQKLKASEKWIEDGDVSRCMGCKAEFSFLLRKHHCRLCGKIYCNNCSNNWIMTTMSSKKIRACNMCYILHKEEQESTNTPPGGSPEDDASVQIPQKMSRKWTNNTPSPSNSSVERQAVTSGDGSPNNPSTVSSQGTPPVGGSGPEKDATDGGGETLYDDDQFEEITEEEIARSLSSESSKCESSLVRSLTMSAEDVEQGKAVSNEQTDLWVRAGFAHAVPVVIDKPGIVLCWEFRTEPKGISFSVTYKASENTAEEDAQVLVPLCKCNSHRQDVQGELTARQPGMYTLIFDNTLSRFTSKKLFYKLNVHTSL